MRTYRTQKNMSWCRARRSCCLLYAAIVYATFIIIYVTCGSFYDGQTFICFSRLSTRKTGTIEEERSPLKHTTLDLQLVANVTTKGAYERERIPIIDYSLDKNESEERKSQHELRIAREANTKKRQPQPEDILQPLREMFAKAGEEDKVKGKLVNGTSIEVPLTDLRVKVDQPKVLLLVIVSSAPARQDRRNAIRETWWNNCGEMAKCLFFTDGLQLQDQQKNDLLEERNTFKDIELEPTEEAAIIFGERFLYQILWAKAKFNFQYLLRLDDDYFVCMDRLLNELPSRPKTNLNWGWYHCKENLVYMDEAWVLFSIDVIEQFLAQDLRSMLCHPFGDQTFTLWINATGINLTDFDDHRLHHWPPAGKINKFFSMTSICDKHIGIHGSYPDLMRRLSMNSGDGPKPITPVTLLSDACPLPKVFDVDKVELEGVYKFSPKLCLEKPRWVSSLKSWQGAQK